MSSPWRKSPYSRSPGNPSAANACELRSRPARAGPLADGYELHKSLNPSSSMANFSRSEHSQVGPIWRYRDLAHSHLCSKWPGGGDLLWPKLTASAALETEGKGVAGGREAARATKIRLRGATGAAPLVD